MLQPTPYKEVTFLQRFLFTKKGTLNLDKLIYKFGQNLSAQNICQLIDTRPNRYHLEFINKSCDSANFIKYETQLISRISQWNEQMVQ